MKNLLENLTTKLPAYHLLIISISFVYIFFGFLKIILQSPIRELVVATLPFMQDDRLFQFFGLIEVLLGIGLLIKRLRIYAAIAIILHLLGTFSTIIFAPALLFNNLIPTLHGEFVFKNLIILAAALLIIQSESKSSYEYSK